MIATLYKDPKTTANLSRNFIQVLDCGPSFYGNLQGKPQSARKEAPVPATEEEPLTNFVRIDKVGGDRIAVHIFCSENIWKLE